MTVNSQLTEKDLDTKVAEKYRLQEIAEKYRLQGFKVLIEPSKPLLPFDLGNYLPDLIARKSLDRGYIIELKNSISQISVDFSNLSRSLSRNCGDSCSASWLAIFVDNWGRY
jgi:hypothetical protein